MIVQLIRTNEPYYVLEKQITSIGKVGYREFEVHFEGGGQGTFESISYPISPKMGLDTLNVHNSTDISGLTSVIEKMNETLEKVLEKLDFSW